LISFGVTTNINSEGNEKYVTLLLANLLNLHGEDFSEVKNDMFPENSQEKTGFTAFEIKEK